MCITYLKARKTCRFLRSRISTVAKETVSRMHVKDAAHQSKEKGPPVVCSSGNRIEVRHDTNSSKYGARA